MAIIRGSLAYNGDVEELSFDEIELAFWLPCFTYKLDDKSVYRVEGPTITKTVVSSLRYNHYKTTYPGELIAREDSNSFVAWAKGALAEPLSVDTLKLDIPYSIYGPDKLNISQGELTALFYFDIVALSDIPNRGLLSNQPQALFNTKTISQLAQKLFLINAERFFSLLKAIQSDIQSHGSISKESFLLMLISQLGQFSGERAELSDLNEQDLEGIVRKAAGLKVEITTGTIDEVIKRFDDLISFPLEIEKISEIKPAGTFRVVTEQSSYPRSELSFYRITVEAVTQTGTNETQYRTWSVDWCDVESEDPISTVEPLPFEVKTFPAIISSSIEGAILVRVIGFDGTILWHRDYKPDSEELRHIDIMIDSYLPGQLAGSQIERSSISHRIRGQVITPDRSQSVSGLTVVIQATATEESLWKPVSSDITGNSGHFSMKYPKGKFIAAQALVSIAPDSAVDINIVDTGVENETISDSYLILMIDPYQLCDDAICSSGSVSRLPDYADLINSDEYSQDLGGRCVNITSPNRTLREYRYNAIVRVTDPEVANYKLEKTAGGFRLVGGTSKIKRDHIDLSNPVRWQDAPGAGLSSGIRKVGGAELRVSDRSELRVSDRSELGVSDRSGLDISGLSSLVRDLAAPKADARLSFYQSVTVAKGHILFYKAVFKADGYSLGDLVYSLPLAPGQKKQIVSYDMANTLEASEAQQLTQGERLAAELLDERIITDELSGGISESLQGRSSASTSGFSAGLGLGVSMGKFGGSLGVAGGYSNSRSSASNSGARDISQSFAEKLRQALIQNAESYRALNASVVTTVKEGQEYAVTTEVVANHNHCHSVTMMFFEVLRHYAITQELVDVQECVFVPLLLTDFTPENISKWKDVLAANLLPIPSSTYLQPPWFTKYIKRHPLAKAFDANERIKTDYARVDYPEGMYAEDNITSISGEIRLRTKLPRPRTQYDRILSLPVVARTEVTKEVDVKATAIAMLPFNGLRGIQYSTTEEHFLEKARVFDQFMTLDDNFQTVPPAEAIRVHTFKTETVEVEGESTEVPFFVNRNDEEQWQAYATILGYTEAYELLQEHFAGNLISEWDRIFYQDIAPLVLTKIVDSIRIGAPVGEDAPSLDDLTLMTRYTGGEKLIRIRINGSYSAPRTSLSQTTMNLYSNSEDVRQLNRFTTMIVENVRIQYTTAHFNGYIYNGYVGNDLLDGADLLTPLTPRDKRNPRIEDEYLVDELFEHLNSNLEYYNKVLWRNLDPDRRYMLLDGFGIEVYDRSGISLGDRSLASIVKNDLITIVGNSLVFPVADGYRVGTHLIVDSEETETQPSLLDHYRPAHEVEPYRLSVPTRGVYMESVMGQCDACEDVKEDSSQDWDRFRTEEPTAISPVTTPTPTRTDWRAIWAQFAQPLVALQTPRETPAPGAGLEGLSEALAKADAFRDVTGLAGNQENVIRTYLSNQENARAFAEMAKTMAMQEHNSENSRSIMRSLSDAREQGAISDDDYSELVRDHLGQQIDGGTRRQADERRELAQEPSLTDAAIEAVGQGGREVNAQRTDSDGTRESLQVSSGAAGTPIDRIFYNVELVSQPTERSCWAAAMAMIENYRRSRFEPDQPSLTAEQFVDGAGLVLDESYSWNDLQVARAHYGFQSDPEVDGHYYPDAEKWRDFLRRHGPLYISVESNPTSHAIVVHGISGNLTEGGCLLDILDPYPPTVGTPSRQISVQDLNARFNGGDLSQLEVYDDWRILFHPGNTWASVEPTGTRGRPIYPDPRGQNITYFIPSVFAPNNPDDPSTNRDVFFVNMKNIICWIAICRTDGGNRVIDLLNNHSNFDQVFTDIRNNNFWGEFQFRLRVTRNSNDVIEHLEFYDPYQWYTTPPVPYLRQRMVRIGVASYYPGATRMAVTKANLRNVERELETLYNPNHWRDDGSISFNFNLRQSILGQFEANFRIGYAIPPRGLHITWYEGINSQIQDVLMPGYLQPFPDDAMFEVVMDVVLYEGTNPLICSVISSYARAILPHISGTLPDQRTTAQRIWDFCTHTGTGTGISAVTLAIDVALDAGTGVFASLWDSVQMGAEILAYQMRPLLECFGKGYFDCIGFHPPVDMRDSAYAGGFSMEEAREKYVDGWNIGNSQREVLYRELWNNVLVPELSESDDWDQSYTDFLNANDEHRYVFIAQTILGTYRTIDSRTDYVRGVLARNS